MDTACRVSVIVPTYNERENIVGLLEQLLTVGRASALHLEVVVADDDSPDGTADAIEGTPRFSECVRVLRRKGQRNLSRAVLEAIALTSSPIVLVMDADFSHPPEAIPSLVRALTEGGADFAIGSRHVHGGRIVGWGLWRRLNSRVATWLARPLTKVKDPLSGFFAFKRELLRPGLPLSPTGYKIGLELLVKTRVSKIAEVPICFQNRTRGRSKFSPREQIRYVRHLWSLYLYRFGVRRARDSRTNAPPSS